ncbi:iron-containing redox enzyme family protein [Corallococcus sp. H22C18031201]|uniref:TenA family transcriptional regulator n=1 Tax=Citreicoccus inhibens TaxID=2849499 RepID=UPI000E70F9DA|nr:iron-containing redox enzyme family protein [Citreicoccus inhibens]MBU8899452.1 iron-containing redox enzyme family protein [Citreicoccus inhibens]RJS17067.1 iron-containing redox enzyme family protein [Corallococcus sp. H22C18031201]
MRNHSIEAALAKNSSREQLIKHRFFEVVDEKTFSVEQAELVLGQWWHPLHYFPTFLGRLIAVCPNLEMKTAVTHILNQEVGEGDVERAHERFFIQTMTDAGMARAAVSEANMTPATQRLLDGYARSTDNYLTGLGFLYGTEVADLTMVAKLGKLVRRTTGLKSLPWVDIHVKQEPDHVQTAGQTVGLTYTDAEMATIVKGAEEMWQLWVGFFEELRNRVV